MMADTFVGGSETTTNALSAARKLLIENPDIWERLKSDQEKYLKVFVEDVLRLESPVQSLMRTAAKDITFHGVDIPKGSVVNVRYAAANRDERAFDEQEKINLLVVGGLYNISEVSRLKKICNELNLSEKETRILSSVFAGLTKKRLIDKT